MSISVLCFVSLYILTCKAATWLHSGWEPIITVCAVYFNLLVATLVLSASQVCRMADLCVLTGVFCDYADLLPQVLLAFPHAVARRHAQSHYYLSVGQR